MDNIFLFFSLIFGLAVLAGLVMQALRLPTFLGYVLVGLVFGWLAVGSKTSADLLSLLSSAGVMLLLFLVGLEMNIATIKELGKRVVVIGLGQLLVSFLIFGLILVGFGFSGTVLLVCALALAFSSTIIVVRLLSEKRELETTHGRVVVAVLLIQDLAAISLLLVMGEKPSSVGLLLVKTGVLILTSVLISKRVMPALLHKLAKSADELILFSLAWCFIVAALVSSKFIGLSLEVGGFLAGLALSGSFEHLHIVNKVKPIRDFFLTVFFISLGLSIKLDARSILPAIYLALAVLVFKPLVVWLLMRLVGYRQKAAFISGLLIGQTSEFSFIVIGLVARWGYLAERQIGVISMAGILSMVVSSYLITRSDSIYKVIRPVLNIIWRDRGEAAEVSVSYADHVVLFGCHRMGASVLSNLEKKGETVVVVDHDPDVVEKLRALGKTVFYGDVTDTEAYNAIGLAKAKLIISTVKDIKDSLQLLLELKRRKLTVPVVVDAETREEADDLYKAGAAYAVFPHFVGGMHLGDLIKHGHINKEDLLSYKINQEEALKGTYD